jgi:hypothetical protein
VASAIADQIENQFATLPPQAQLTVLEPLIHQMRAKVPSDTDGQACARELEAMAADPAIQKELSEIEEEFRRADSDGLKR